MTAQTHQYTLGPKSSEALKQLATKLGISEGDVIRNGILVMALYADIKQSNKEIIVLKNLEDNTETELLLA